MNYALTAFQIRVMAETDTDWEQKFSLFCFATSPDIITTRRYALQSILKEMKPRWNGVVFHAQTSHQGLIKSSGKQGLKDFYWGTNRFEE